MAGRGAAGTPTVAARRSPLPKNVCVYIIINICHISQCRLCGGGGAGGWSPSSSCEARGLPGSSSRGDSRWWPQFSAAPLPAHVQLSSPLLLRPAVRLTALLLVLVKSGAPTPLGEATAVHVSKSMSGSPGFPASIRGSLLRGPLSPEGWDPRPPRDPQARAAAHDVRSRSRCRDRRSNRLRAAR